MTLFANWAFWIQRRRVGTTLNTFCISMRFVYACVGWWLMCFCMTDFRLRALTWIFLFLTGSTQATKSFCASEGAGSPTVYCMHEQVSEVCYQPRGGWQDGVLVWCMCLSASAWQLPISVSSCTFLPLPLLPPSLQVSETEMMLTKWMQSVSELRDQYNWLLFFSMPKLLHLSHLLQEETLNMELIVHEISFLCCNEQATLKSVQKMVEVRT